jgi:hypothetical protein
MIVYLNNRSREKKKKNSRSWPPLLLFGNYDIDAHEEKKRGKGLLVSSILISFFLYQQIEIKYPFH